MAGSYRHVTNSDGSFRGLDLIDNLGDAYEAIEEMHDMIRWFAERADFFDDPRAATSNSAITAAGTSSSTCLSTALVAMQGSQNAEEKKRSFTRPPTVASAR